MSDHDALLAALIADPDDDTARLVFADWLQENGDEARAEFIRVEVELARTPPLTENDERRRKVLLTRRDELFKQHSRAWLEPFLPHARDVTFARGFVQSLAVSAHSYLQHGPRWVTITPLARVHLTTCSIWDQATHETRRLTEPLFASRLLGRLEEVNLAALGLTAAEMELFARCPDLSRLRELVLTWNDIRTEGAIVLAGMPQLRTLESLDLRHNRILAAGVRALVESPHLVGLKELRIGHNGFKENSWVMLQHRFGDALVG